MPRSLPPRPRGGRLPAALALALLLLAGPGRPADADACSDCPGPTLDDLRTQSGFGLETRSLWGGLVSAEDRVETNANGCSYAAAGDPRIDVGAAFSVLRGWGEVWNCPESKSSTEIGIEIAEGDSTSWHVEGEVSAEVNAVALKLAVKLGGGFGRGHVVTEVRSYRQTIEAQPGHRIPWEGYFLLAPLTLTIDLSVTRNWSWWTKNDLTGHEVHRSGTIDVPCGTQTVAVTRQASVGAYLHLSDRACGAAPGSPAVDLGPFPPAAPPVTTPGVPPPFLAPDAGGDDGEDGGLPQATPQGHDLPDLPAPVPAGAPDDAPVAPRPEGGPAPVEEPTGGARPPSTSGDLPEAPTGPCPDPFPLGAPALAPAAAPPTTAQAPGTGS